MRYKYNPIALLLLPVMLILAVPAWAQQQVKLSGTVIDDEQNPVIFAIVKVEGQVAATTTDLNGRYHLSFSTADTVVVQFSMMGYETKTKRLVKPRGDLRLNVTLQSQSLNMGEVTVKEVRRQMTSTQKLNARDLKKLPSTTGNAVEELVATQAGVSTHNELSSQYNVRGGSFDENLVYINGIEVYRPMLVSSGQQEGLSVINSDMVEEINFSAGGFEAKYGDRMSSVLDITYKKPKQLEASVQGSLLGGSAYVGYADKRNRINMTHGVRYKTNQYMMGSLETKGEYSPRFVDYQTYINLNLNRHWSFDVIANIAQNKYDFIPADRETNFGTIAQVNTFKVYFDGREQDVFRTLFGAATLKYSISPAQFISLTASAFETREKVSYDIQGQYWLSDTHTNQQLGVGTYMEHERSFMNAKTNSIKLAYETKWRNHNLSAALTYKNEKMKEYSREWERRDSAGYNMPGSSERLDFIYNLAAETETHTHRIEWYVQDYWRHETESNIFTLNYGFRLAHWSWNKETLFSPRVTMGYIPKAHDNLTLRLATGLYYQAPFYKELRDTVTVNKQTRVVLNPNIKSQRSLQIVCGADYKFKMAGRPFKFTTEAYYKHMTHVNPYNIDNVKTIYYGQNLGKGYVTGADFKLFGEFVEGTDSWISLSLMKAQQTINGRSFPQATDQRYNLNFFFTDFFPHTTRWRLTLKACLADGLPFSPPHTGLERMSFKAPAYKRVDIGMSYRLLDEDSPRRRQWAKAFRNIWLSVECFNLLDISNVSSYYWVTDVTNQQYAVPNYLTGRLLNARIQIEL